MKLIGDEVDFLIEFFVETIPVGFFALAGGDTVLDANARKIDSRKGTVTTGDWAAIGLWEDRRHDASAAAHGSDFGFIVAWLVVFEVKWRVNKDEVREEALAGNFHGALEEVVVWISWVVVDTFLNLEDRNWEDRCFVMAKTGHGSLENHLGDETTFWSSVGAEVNGSEWNLSTGTRMHSIEVVNETFHSLVGLALGVGLSVGDDLGRDFKFLDFSVIAQSKVFWNGNLEFFFGEVLVFLDILFEAFAIGFVNAWSKSVVDVWNSLTTVLLVLVGLEDNGS